MNLSNNKHLLEGQITEKQELILKFIEFASQYTLKLNEYRLLNPINSQNFDHQRINKYCSLMCELEAYSCPTQKASLLKSNTERKNRIKENIQTGNIKKQQKKQYIPGYQETKSVFNKQSVQIPQRIQQKKQLNQTRIDKSKSRQKYYTASKSKLSPSKSISTTELNSNKHFLQQQIYEKEQQALKGMQFATQFFIKQAEYRLLNPFYFQSSNLNSMNRKNDLMAELSSYSIIKKNTISHARSKIKNSTFVKHKEEEIAFQKQKLIKNQLLDLKVLEKIQFFQEQTAKIAFKRTSSQLSYREYKNNQNKKENQQDKLQKENYSSKQNNNKDNYLGINFNFKKNKRKQVQKCQLTESLILQKESKQCESGLNDDSFENFEFNKSKISSQSNKIKQKSLNQSDVISYRSSLFLQIQDKKMKAVSQRLSEQQQSVIVGIDYNNLKGKYQQKNHQDELRNDKLPFRQSSHIFLSHIQKQVQLNQRQISKYLMKLQSFQIQQQMLIKRTQKIWSKQFDCIKKLKQTSWKDLNLPKALYKESFFQYAKVIQ